MAKGYVYVLSNPSMPDVVKIGHSINGGKNRASALFVTGVPLPFTLEFEILVDEPYLIEQATHENLGEFRVHGSREFFRCSVGEAITAILEEFVGDHDLAVCHLDEFQAVEGAKDAGLRSKTATSFYEVCHAIRFVTSEAIDEAIAKNKKWLKSRRPGGTNG